MAATIHHRGPDHGATYRLPHLALAIRRLSIIDLTTGNQPISNEAGDVTLVFNGEIYNFREVRKGLEERGHCFRTRSDGEVIVHLYEELGAGCVGELNGMFAIALWDAKRRRLLLARDRTGEKPLFYWQKGETLVFGSELKALLRYPGVSRELNVEALRTYFALGYFAGPESVFRGIRKLPAAHTLVVENGRITLQPYWELRNYLRPPGAPRPAPGQVEEWTRELRTRIRDAAVSRLVSDVPLGVFLSGGLDSSTLVAVMSDLTPGNVNSFSVAFQEKSFSEAGYAQLVARRFNTRHHVMTADETALHDGLNHLAAVLDEPLADPAAIPTFLLSRFARQQVKVALSGEGSDELFGGYPTYMGARVAHAYLRLPKGMRRFVLRRLRPLLPVSSGAVPLGLFLSRFLEYVERPPAERHLTWFGVMDPDETEELFAVPGGAPGGPNPMATLLENLLRGAEFEDTLAQLLYIDFRTYLEDNLLVKIDRASMACSLELRTPFLDHRLIQFAAALPSSLKVRGFRLKHILKDAVAPWLPAAIVKRQKRGFSVPVARLLRRELRPLIAELLAGPRLKQQGLFNAGYVERLVAEHWSGRRDHRKSLWAMLCFQLWRQHWMEAG